mmetsp:Transcript_34335/g.73318  ORF Transcript_34335/g.73318 Transcript_34335/m.73318 type:complete len:333 (-) Transcript_34335:341-1339(-)
MSDSISSSAASTCESKPMRVTIRWSGSYPGGGPSLSSTKTLQDVLDMISLNLEPPEPRMRPTIVLGTIRSFRMWPAVVSSCAILRPICSPSPGKAHARSAPSLRIRPSASAISFGSSPTSGGRWAVTCARLWSKEESKISISSLACATCEISPMITQSRWASEQPGGGPSRSRMKMLAPVLVTSSLYVEPPAPMSRPTTRVSTSMSCRAGGGSCSSSCAIFRPLVWSIAGQPLHSRWPSWTGLSCALGSCAACIASCMIAAVTATCCIFTCCIAICCTIASCDARCSACCFICCCIDACSIAARCRTVCWYACCCIAACACCIAACCMYSCW